MSKVKRSSQTDYKTKMEEYFDDRNLFMIATATVATVAFFTRAFQYQLTVLLGIVTSPWAYQNTNISTTTKIIFIDLVFSNSTHHFNRIHNVSISWFFFMIQCFLTSSITASLPKLKKSIINTAENT